MQKLCEGLQSFAGASSSSNCDPSQLSDADLEDFIQWIQNTTLFEETLQAWRDIVAVVELPQAMIQDLIDTWLPQLKDTVMATTETIRQLGVEEFFGLESWDLGSFGNLLSDDHQSGKYGYTRFFEAASHVAAELDASTNASEILDDTANLFADVQFAVMALEGKVFDFESEKGILNTIESVVGEIGAFFQEVMSDFLDFSAAQNFFNDPDNVDVWEGKTPVELGIAFATGDHQVLIDAFSYAGKTSISWQVLKVITEVTEVSNTRLLQVSELTVEKRIQMGVSAGSSHATTAIRVEANTLKNSMDEIDNEINLKAPDDAFGGTTSSSLT